ncbi:MAG: D-alanyl-D-alanine carboxypeptidase [Ruminococcaceae bacterium]|nr:D-alanyl-D-alanine carboxypeptidase [Oscillospiraceae bacterium]
MKKLTLFILIFALLSLCLPISTVSAASKAPDISAVSAILIDARTGYTLYEKNATDKMYPASTTKIITYLVISDAIENGEIGLDEMLVYTREMQDAMDPTGSHIELKAGEKMSVDNLIRAMLIASGNDAATLLATSVGGTEKKFVSRMNEKVKELELKNTHFTNAHGLTDEKHYTTAYDLAIAARYAMQDDYFREIVGSQTLTIPPTNMRDTERYFINTNNLISPLRYSKYYYEKATGIKTGYTSAAGSCLVASAKEKDRELICVILKSETSHDDAKAILEYGFKNFKQVKVTDKNAILGEVKVKQGADGKDYVRAVAENDVIVTIPVNVDIDKVTSKISYNSEKVYAPVSQGVVLGQITYFYNNDVVGITNIIAEKKIERHALGALMSFWDAVWGCTVVRVIIYILLIALLLFLLLVGYGFYRSLKKSRAKKRRRSNYRPPLY